MKNVLFGTSQQVDGIERAAGVPVAVRRIFNGSEVGKLAAVARAEFNRGVKEVEISFKPPKSEATVDAWQECPDGWIDTLVSQLVVCKTEGINVYVAVNHEPEGGNEGGDTDEPSGGPGFKALTKRIGTKARAAGVLDMFGVILMGFTMNEKDPDVWVQKDSIGWFGVDQYFRVQTATRLIENRNFTTKVLDYARKLKETHPNVKRVHLSEFAVLNDNQPFTPDLVTKGAGLLEVFIEDLRALPDGIIDSVAYFANDGVNGGVPLTGAMLNVWANAVKESATYTPPVAALEKPVITDVRVNQNLEAVIVQVTATQKANNALRYRIDWGDGVMGTFSLTGATRTHEYAAPGSYTITARVQDWVTGLFANSVTRTVVIEPEVPPNTPPVLRVEPLSTQRPYVGDVVTFLVEAEDDVDSAEAMTYAVSFGDGQSASIVGLTQIDRAYAAAGTYVLTVGVTDSGGLTTVQAFDVVVLERPVVDEPEESPLPPTEVNGTLLLARLAVEVAAHNYETEAQRLGAAVIAEREAQAAYDSASQVLALIEAAEK